MAHLEKKKIFGDDRGSLIVIENIPNFEIKRVFYIYDAKDVRGGHRHKKTNQVLICVKGSCDVYSCDGKIEQVFHLDSPEKLLFIDAIDWHEMFNFSDDAVLLVLSSELYDADDYISKKYEL